MFEKIRKKPIETHQIIVKLYQQNVFYLWTVNYTKLDSNWRTYPFVRIIAIGHTGNTIRTDLLIPIMINTRIFNASFIRTLVFQIKSSPPSGINVIYVYMRGRAESELYINIIRIRNIIIYNNIRLVLGKRIIYNKTTNTDCESARPRWVHQHSRSGRRDGEKNKKKIVILFRYNGVCFYFIDFFVFRAVDERRLSLSPHFWNLYAWWRPRRCLFCGRKIRTLNNNHKTQPL